MKTLILAAILLLLVACQPSESVINESAQPVTLDSGLMCVYIGAYQGGVSCDWETYRDKHEPQAEAVEPDVLQRIEQDVAGLPLYCRHVALWHDGAEARECMDLYRKELGQ